MIEYIYDKNDLKPGSRAVECIPSKGIPGIGKQKKLIQHSITELTLIDETVKICCFRAGDVLHYLFLSESPLIRNKLIDMLETYNKHNRLKLFKHCDGNKYVTNKRINIDDINVVDCKEFRR